jgi:hypothetical protein
VRETLRGGEQKGVVGHVAKPVVHRLEVIEAHEDHGGVAIAAVAAGERPLGRVHEGRAVLSRPPVLRRP